MKENIIDQYVPEYRNNNMDVNSDGKEKDDKYLD